MTKPPKYVTDFVASLDEKQARAQFARMMTKSIAAQRENAGVTSVTVTNVEWNPLDRVYCSRCATTTHSYSTAEIVYGDGRKAAPMFYCNTCHDEQWSWL